MAEYDKIAKDYEKSKNSRGAKYLFDPSVRRMVGDVTGLDILDFGCGNGYTTRELKSAGAKNIVGFDISDGQIKIAKEVEQNNPMDINYYVYSATDVPFLGQFDIVMAKFVLHYSSNRKELTHMFEGAYRNLKSSGRFIALIPDFKLPLPTDPKYGYTSETKGRFKEGGKIRTSLYLEEELLCKFDNYYWKLLTYEECAKKAGFKTISWHKVEPSKEDIQRFGKKFWTDYLNFPGHIILEAAK